MKKPNLYNVFSFWEELLKMLQIMKFTCFLLLISTLQLSASVYSQQTLFTVEFKNSSLYDLMSEIKSSSEFDFVYSDDEIEDVTVNDANFNNSTVEEILSVCLKGKSITHSINNNVIILKPVNKIIEEKENKKIRGKVVDENGVPLPGVSVVIEETNIGVATDVEGDYCLVFDKKDAVLVFSFVGMTSQKIRYTGQVIQNVTLTTDSEQVSEITVYGTGLTKISKERATGSYTVMSGSEIEDSPDEEIKSSLEGNLVGLQEHYNSETQKNEIVVRGLGSIESDSKPLIVVDGFPVEGDFSTVNPNDIESVTILKDAAAASIWGARAGNGVIVIVTKKGKNTDKINVEIGSYLKIGDRFDLDYNLPRASSANQLRYEKYLIDNGYENFNEGIPNQLKNVKNVYSKGVQAYYDYKRGMISELDLNNTINRLKTINYQDDVKKYLLRQPVTQQYNLRIGGGSDKLTYNLSVLYNNVERASKRSEGEKVLINFRNTYQIKDWLGVRFSFMTEISKENNSGIKEYELKNISPYENLINDDGSYSHVERYVNSSFLNPIVSTASGMPYSNMKYNPIQEVMNRDYISKNNITRFQSGFDVKICKGLRFTPGFKYEKKVIEKSFYDSEETFELRYTVNNKVSYNEQTNTVEEVHLPKGGILEVGDLELVSYDLRNQINYDNKFDDDHEINFVSAVEHIWKKEEEIYYYLYGYDPDKNIQSYPPYGYGSSERVLGNLFNVFQGEYLPAIKKGYLNTRLFSFFSNLAYTFKQRYTITGSVRTDASNMIVDDPKFRYSPFWSVGGSWNMKRETFLERVNFIDRLILRSTYGVAGNTIKTASMLPLIEILFSNRVGEYAANIMDRGNPTLRWERIKQLNLATDFSLFNRLLYGSFEVYSKQSEDLLARTSIPSTYGSSVQLFNSAKVSNKGIEIDLNSDVKIGGFLWNIEFNYSYNANKVKTFNQSFIRARDIVGYKFVEGASAFPTYSLVYGGMNSDNIPTIMGENGIQYTMNQDLNAEGESGTEILRNMGSLIAPTVLSLKNTFNYKGFTFRALLTAKFGHVFRRSTFNYNVNPTKRFYHEDLNDIINGKADEMGLPDLYDGYNQDIYRWGFYVPYLNTLVEDAGHIRLKELYLGYSIPDKILKKLGLETLRVYTHARNLGTIWTANSRGIDPEYVKGQSFKPGVSYTIGFNLGF